MKLYLAAGSAIVALMLLPSCSKKIFLDVATPQEQSLVLTKITDENQNLVIGNQERIPVSNKSKSGYGCANGFTWNTNNLLAVSPDGEYIAYISLVDEMPNVMVKKPSIVSPSTQRTFRRAKTVNWGRDGRIYFTDNTTGSAIGSIDANKGSLIKQVTNNNNDWDPALTPDGKLLYFTRYDNSGPTIWTLNVTNGELTNCTRGYGAVPVGDSSSKIICTRNSVKGNSELWLIDFEKGDETLLLADKEKGFTNPSISPDGKWLVCVGNSISTITKKNNTDIYAVRTDGTQLTQITYHPEIDCSPVFSADGKYIYFISTRANKEKKFCIWRIDNPLD